MIVKNKKYKRHKIPIERVFQRSNTSGHWLGVSGSHDVEAFRKENPKTEENFGENGKNVKLNPSKSVFLSSLLVDSINFLFCFQVLFPVM